MVVTQDVDKIIKETCIKIALCYDMHFLEIGTDNDHVHFLIQSVPMMLPQQIVQTVKSITAKQVFKLSPETKAQMWGGHFWSAGYYINTVSKHGSENAVSKYVKEQGTEKEYVKLHQDQLKLL